MKMNVLHIELYATLIWCKSYRSIDQESFTNGEKKRYVEKINDKSKCCLQYERQLTTNKTKYNPKLPPTLQRESDFANTLHLIKLVA